MQYNPEVHVAKKIVQQKLPRNVARKLAYKRMASEGEDKEQRNNQLSKLAGDKEVMKTDLLNSEEHKVFQAAKNDYDRLQAKLRKQVDSGITKGLEALNKEFSKAVEIYHSAADQYSRLTSKLKNLKVVAGENTNTKAGKRLARKAKANKKVADFKHAEGNCGNVGCGKCFPEISSPEARFTRYLANRPQRRAA